MVRPGGDRKAAVRHSRAGTRGIAALLFPFILVSTLLAGLAGGMASGRMVVAEELFGTVICADPGASSPAASNPLTEELSKACRQFCAAAQAVAHALPVLPTVITVPATRVAVLAPALPRAALARAPVKLFPSAREPPRTA